MPVISKIKLPSSNSRYDLHDARINGIDDSPTEDSTNIVYSGGLYDYILENCVIARDIEEENQEENIGD